VLDVKYLEEKLRDVQPSVDRVV